MDVAVTGDLIQVTDGVYQTGARDVYAMSNRVAVTKPVTVQSVNGPGVTSIVGYQVPGTTIGAAAVRCVYLTNGAVLAGFTLTNGATQTSGDMFKQMSGGGVWCESGSSVVSNCVLTGNSAYGYGGGAYSGRFSYSGRLNNCTLSRNSAGEGGGAVGGTLNICTLSGNSVGKSINQATYGGGAYYGTLNNCTLSGNSAAGEGGGTYSGKLSNCTLSGNSAGTAGGGAYSGTLNNCIVYYNSAPDGNYDSSSTLNYCCTTPLPASGTGNLTNAPLLVNLAGGDLHLQTNSHSINAGLNAYAVGATDLDGNPRISGGTVDVGAYEFQGTGLTGFTAWLWQYGLPTDGSADYLDTDHDGLNNWQEWLCGTVPTNAFSVLRMVESRPAGTNVTVTWQSVAGVSYFLERGTTLAGHPAFSLLATNLLGQAWTTSYTDTNAAGGVQLFYRVGVGSYVTPTNPPRPVITWQGDLGAGTLTLSWSAMVTGCRRRPTV